MNTPEAEEAFAKLLLGRAAGKDPDPTTAFSLLKWSCREMIIDGLKFVLRWIMIGALVAVGIKLVLGI